MPQRDAPDGDLIARLTTLDTGVVSDSLDILGLAGVAHGLSRFTTRKQVAGAARTIVLGEIAGALDPATHLGVRTIESASPGDVLVVAHNSRCDAAGWGGLLTRAAVGKGLAGIVVDGAFRDADECEELGMPIFARCVTPITARGRVVEVAVDVAVDVCGVTVRPGDLVIADGSGVVFVPAECAAAVIGGGEKIVAAEARMARLIDEGSELRSVLGAAYERMLVAPRGERRG